MGHFFSTNHLAKESVILKMEENGNPIEVVDLKKCDYKLYLLTQHWRKVRTETIIRYGGRCAVCNSPNELDVHHRTYERRGHEEPFDTIVLCRHCHETFHKNGKLHRQIEFQTTVATPKIEPLLIAGDKRILEIPELAAIRQIWSELVRKVGGGLSMKLAVAEAIAIEEPDVVVIAAKPGYESLVNSCGLDESREAIAHALQRLLRQPVTIRYHRNEIKGARSS